MAVSGAIFTQFSSPSPSPSPSPSIISSSRSKSNPRIKPILVGKALARIQFGNSHSSSSLSTFSTTQFTSKFKVNRTHFSPKASASSYPVGSSDYIVEPTTDVKFKQSLNLPGCSYPVVLFGTGYREKVFAIIGVKVYAAGFYATPSLIETLSAWKGRSAAEIQGNSSLYDSIFQAHLEKSLHIVLVRDIDGKTFWDALDEAISPRIKASTPDDESALSQFRSTFQGRSLKKGTHIFLTWVEPSKMLVCISTDGLPSTIDATIKSINVTRALFDVFFGDRPVSPSLKASVSNGLSMILK